MSIVRRHLADLSAIMIVSAFSIVAAACSLIPATRADCNVVRLQREAGRSDAEIASALGVSQDDVAKCGSASSETSGEMGSPAGGGASAPGSESAPAQPPTGGESGGGDSGSGSSPY
jgi:hypothetical protein